MKPIIIFLLVFICSVSLYAQTDTTHKKRIGIAEKDSSKKEVPLIKNLPLRVLMIKKKDLKEIKKMDRSAFKIIDDTSRFAADELSSGLTEEELQNYQKNKNETKQLLAPPVSEEEEYPTISTIRKVLQIVKTAGVIVILILSIL